MPFTGPQLQARDVAALAAAHWHDADLVKIIATLIAESYLFLGAYHDNLGPDGKITSRDCGIGQVNVPASAIGSAEELKLRVDAAYNLERCWALWSSPMTRAGKMDKRRFEPWVAFSSGWATFGEAWVWHQQDGKPTGPWVKTGRAIHQAIRGVANYHFFIKQDLDLLHAQNLAQQYADQFKVKGVLRVNSADGVYWEYPKAPSSPPADGIGPRPVGNQGL